MKGETKTKPQPEPDPANLSQEELASNQDGKSVPWFCGERKLAVTWLTPVYNLVSKKSESAKK